MADALRDAEQILADRRMDDITSTPKPRGPGGHAVLFRPRAWLRGGTIAIGTGPPSCPREERLALRVSRLVIASPTRVEVLFRAMDRSFPTEERESLAASTSWSCWTCRGWKSDGNGVERAARQTQLAVTKASSGIHRPPPADRIGLVVFSDNAYSSSEGGGSCGTARYVAMIDDTHPAERRDDGDGEGCRREHAACAAGFADTHGARES